MIAARLGIGSVVLIALLVLGVLLVAPSQADARRPTNQSSATKADAVRLSADITRLQRTVRARGGSADPATVLADARALRTTLAGWKALMGRYERTVRRSKTAGSPRENALVGPTFDSIDSTLDRLEQLGGVSGAPSPERQALETEATTTLSKELLETALVATEVRARLNELGLARKVLSPRGLRVLRNRLETEVTAIVQAQIPTLGGVSAFEALESGQPLAKTAKQALKREVATFLGQLTVRTTPAGAVIFFIPGFAEKLGEISNGAVRVATWPVDRLVRFVRGIGRSRLTLADRVQRSVKGFNRRTLEIRCRLRATLKAKPGAKACKGYPPKATSRQAANLVALNIRDQGLATQLIRDLESKNANKLLRQLTAALKAHRKAITAMEKAYLFDSLIVRYADDNHTIACMELERLDRIIAELEKKAAPPPAAPAPSIAPAQPAAAPPPPGLGAVSEALCPGGVTIGGDTLTLDWSGPVNPGAPFRTDPNTSGGFECRYVENQPSEVPKKTRLGFTYYREERSTKFCDVLLNQGGFLNSLTHDIQVFVNPVVDGADALRGSLITKASGAKIGWPC